MAEFDPFRAIEVLRRHDVRFIVVGGIAAIAQGHPLTTRDLDVTPARDEENCERLALALRELNAKLRTPQGSVDFSIEPRLLAQVEAWTLSTDAGDLDLVFRPAGTQGFDDLRRDAVEIDLGASVLAASVRDLIRCKEAAGRPKDLLHLEALRATLERIRERDRRGS